MQKYLWWSWLDGKGNGGQSSQNRQSQTDTATTEFPDFNLLEDCSLEKFGNGKDAMNAE